LHNAVRLLRADDGLMLAEAANAYGFTKELYAAAAVVADRPTEKSLIAAARSNGIKPKLARALQSLPKNLRWPGDNNERASLAVLRGGWDRRSPKLVIDYSTSELRAELEVGGETLFLGDWAPRISRGGVPLGPAGQWHCVCWVSDADGDYFEAELPLADGTRLQRQVLLAREDEILFAADAVLDHPAMDGAHSAGPAASEAPGDLDYEWLTPLAANVRFEPAAETREGLLVGRKPRALVLPLALPEWRSDRRFGSLAATAAGLELRQQAGGGRLLAPLFFDLAPRRFDKPRTWRQLTVARDLQRVPREDAVAFRVQIGREQWAAYRSLAPVAGRSYLGQHTFYEFVIGRFGRNGTLKPLIEIE
jgi:hypothetical protein